MELKEVEPSTGIAPRVLTVRMTGAGRGEVLIDGEKVKNCRGVTVHSHVGRATEVTLDLIGLSVDIESEVVGDILADVTAVDSETKRYRIVS